MTVRLGGHTRACNLAAGLITGLLLSPNA